MTGFVSLDVISVLMTHWVSTWCWIRVRWDISLSLSLKLSQMSLLLSTEYGWFLPGWRHDPGFLHWCLPEQEEAGPLETGEDREAAGNGDEGPAAPPGIGPYLPISGCVGSNQMLILPPHRGRQRLVPCPSAQEETSTSSIPASPNSESSSNCEPPVSCLLLSIAIPPNSSQNGPTIPQRPLWLPQPLPISVPACFATEAPTSHGPAAWLHHAVNKSSCHSEDTVRVMDFSPLNLFWELFSMSSAFLEYDQSQREKADLHWLDWSRSAEADLQ